MQVLDEWRHTPAFSLGASTNTTSKNRAANAGLRYHRKIYKQLPSVISDDQEATLLIEPWFMKIDGKAKKTRCSPDTCIIYPDNTGVVIEVKMNWKDGRDNKLLDLYLPVVKSAFGLDVVWPLLVTSNIRGYAHPPILGLSNWQDCMSWMPGDPTPMLLQP